MLQQLSRDERLLLLRFACASAWADGEVKDSERTFIRRFVGKLGLETSEAMEVEGFLLVPPRPDEVDASLVPEQKRAIFLSVVRGVVYADGSVGDEERAQLDALQARLLPQT